MLSSHTPAVIVAKGLSVTSSSVFVEDEGRQALHSNTYLYLWYNGRYRIDYVHAYSMISFKNTVL